MVNDNERYAVIQNSLDQQLTRAAIKEAISDVPGLVRADAARIRNDLFGFVIENVRRDTAEVFAQRLSSIGLECVAVPQRIVPKLMAPMGIQRMTSSANGIECRTVTNQVFIQPAANILLVAAGVIHKEAVKKMKEFTIEEVNWGGVIAFSVFDLPATMTRERRERTPEAEPACHILRIEVFGTHEPFRLAGEAGPKSALFLDNQMLSPNKREVMASAIAKLHATLPGIRVNRGIDRIWDENFIYPSARLFDEENRWHLYQAMQAAKQK